MGRIRWYEKADLAARGSVDCSPTIHRAWKPITPEAGHADADTLLEPYDPEGNHWA